jgi:Swt1-like HEPN
VITKLAELFTLKSAAITADLARVSDEHNLVKLKSDVERATDALIAPHLSQIDYSIRASAIRMAEFYQLFYMLENDMRQFVSSILYDTYGKDWWLEHTNDDVKNYAKINKSKESKEGLPPRSKNLIDYLTFAHLGEIIKTNWDVFGGLFPSCEVERLEKVISRLNLARGPIAHCGYLPEDEVVRLKLAIRDWYSLAE